MKTSIPFLQRACWGMLFILATACTSEGQTTKPDDLIGIIKEQQADHVRQSCSPEGCCCFTWMSLQSFKQDKTPQKVVQHLRSDTRFKAVVNSIRKLSATDWTKLKKQALATRKKTWTELGHISCSAQTDAGKKAEESIAQAIVSLVSEMLK